MDDLESECDPLDRAGPNDGTSSDRRGDSAAHASMNMQASSSLIERRKDVA